MEESAFRPAIPESADCSQATGQDSAEDDGKGASGGADRELHGGARKKRQKPVTG